MCHLLKCTCIKNFVQISSVSFSIFTYEKNDVLFMMNLFLVGTKEIFSSFANFMCRLLKCTYVQSFEQISSVIFSLFTYKKNDVLFIMCLFLVGTKVFFSSFATNHNKKIVLKIYCCIYLYKLDRYIHYSPCDTFAVGIILYIFQFSNF